MRDLMILSRPNVSGSSRDAVGFDVLRKIVASRPNITWAELAQEAGFELSQLGGLSGPLNGWLTSLIKATGSVADPFTFGMTSKTLTAFRDVGQDVFGWGKVSDSLRNAGRGVFDDALNRFLDALPGGLGNDIRVGNVVTRFWLPVTLAVFGTWFIFFRGRKRGR